MEAAYSAVNESLPARTDHDDDHLVDSMVKALSLHDEAFPSYDPPDFFDETSLQFGEGRSPPVGVGGGERPRPVVGPGGLSLGEGRACREQQYLHEESCGEVVQPYAHRAPPNLLYSNSSDCSGFTRSPVTCYITAMHMVSLELKGVLFWVI